MCSHANTEAYFHFNCSLIPSTKPWIFLVFISLYCLNRRCILSYFSLFISYLCLQCHHFLSFSPYLYSAYSLDPTQKLLSQYVFPIVYDALSGIVSIIYMVLPSTIFHIDCVCVCTGMYLSLSYISYWFTDPVEVALVIHRIILCLYLATIY